MDTLSVHAAARLPLLQRLRNARATWLRRGYETHILLPLFALLMLGAIWGVTVHFIAAERQLAQRAAGDSVAALLDAYEAQVVRSVGGIDQTLKVVKYAIEQRGELGTLQELRRQGLLPSPLVFLVSVADANGKLLASNPHGAPLSVEDKAYFRQLRDHGDELLVISAPVADAAGAEATLHFTRRLIDAEGHFAGIVSVAVSPDYFTSSYEGARLGLRGLLGMFGSDGALRAMRVGERLAWPATTHLNAQDGSQANADVPTTSAFDGERRYVAQRALRTYPLTVTAGLSEDEEMATFAQHRNSILWQAGFGSAALAVIVTLVWGWSWHGAKARRQIRRAQATYAAASEASLDAFFVLQAMRGPDGSISDFRIAATNTQAEKMTGLGQQALLRRSLTELLPASRHNGLFEHLVHVSEAGGVHQEEWENHMPQLQARWLHRQVVGVEDGVVAIVRDISERKEAEARMLHLAQHDILTGLPNRSLIGERLAQAIELTDRSGGALLVAFIDLDSFKLVNDGLGHNAGDELLKVVAARMQQCLRRRDLVGRFGGDEFVLLLPAQHDGVQALTPLLDDIRAAVTLPVVLHGQEVQVSCSIGVAVYPRDGADPATLMMNADAAMYRAKDAGRNNVQFYTAAMHAGVEEKLALLEGLRYALDDGQLQVLYQPKVDLHSHRIIGVEALLRWQHPQHGAVSPARFIPLAEESGMIVAIGEWVLQTACRQNRAWQQAGLPPITMSVNVSPRQFDDKRLVSRVQAALRDSGLAPECLELEVTESLIMRDLQQVLDKMGELTAMGLDLSIDDFGTGYSSLSTLKSFPISRLKIDQSFVRDLATSPDDQAIARAIIAMAHQLHLRVIAEGVETEQQRDFLRENGCDEMQGYLYSRPVTADALAQLLARQADCLLVPHLLESDD